jgi:DNA-binding PadR family transcriptional regulator
MKTDTSYTALSLAILGLLSLRHQSGYDLRKTFSTTPMGHFSASPGAIYPALRRLEEARLIEGTVEKQGTLRPRKVYAVTAQGTRLLRQRLLRPITREDIVHRLEELILRFAFMGELLGTDESVSFLRELSSRIVEYLPHLQEHVNVQKKLGNVNGAHALEQGIAKYEATACWAKLAAEKLKEA